MSDNLPAIGEFLVYEEGGRIKINVRLEDETVWLTQPLMAELFQTTQQNVSLHIRNIFAEGELIPEATHKKYLSVRKEGSRDVQRQLDFASRLADDRPGAARKPVEGRIVRVGRGIPDEEERVTDTGATHKGPNVLVVKIRVHELEFETVAERSTLYDGAEILP